jgi:hypothetical protein
MKILCKLGIHVWGKVKQWDGKMGRKCKVCGKVKDA